MVLCACFLAAVPEAGRAHAPPTLVPNGPLRVRGNQLVDASGQTILLRGAQISGLNVANPGDAERRNIAALNGSTFAIMRERWNMNALRLPVSNWIWQRDGQSYLNQVAQIIKAANDANLVVVIAEFEDARAGAPIDTGLPSPEAAAFWRAWAAFFKDNPRVIFDVFNQPSAQNVPGHVADKHLPADWRFWLQGGVAANGRRVLGIQDLVDAIRSTGATQVIAVPSFHDSLDFQGFGADFYIRDSNVMYEVHPYYDHGLADSDRDANFGFLAGRFPMYAGEWGVTLSDDQPGCRILPRDLGRASEIIFQTLNYFEIRGVSWTAFSFEPSRLIADFATCAPTQLDRLWNCGAVLNSPPGMGEFLLLFLTGDPFGFGSLSHEQVASAAGGPAAPVAPGEIISIYRMQLGPDPPAFGKLDASGNLVASLGDTQVLFDGVPSPLFYAGPFQVNVQVPYSVAGKDTTIVQSFYKNVPSNPITIPVVPVAPEVFTAIGTTEAVALNHNGGVNSAFNPAPAGSVVVLYATGAGQTSPPGTTGRPARDPYPTPVLPVSLKIAGASAEILYAGEAPGFVGLLQINALVPALSGPSGPVTASILLTIGDRSSRQGVTMWVQAVGSR